MKKTLFLVAATFFTAFGLTSCLSDKETKTESFYVAAILGDKNDSYFKEIANSVAYTTQGNGFGYAITMMDSATDYNTQIEGLKILEKNSATLGKLAGVILLPGNIQVESYAANRIKELNVPLVCIDSPVSENSPLTGLYKTIIMTDNFTSAQDLYKEAEATVDSLEQILVVSQNKTSASRTRLEAVEKYAGDKLINIMVEPTDLANTTKKIEEAIDSNPQIKTIVALNGSSVSGEVLDYLKEKDITMFTFDYNTIIEYGLFSGIIKRAYAQDSEGMGYLGVWAVISSEEIPSPIYLSVKKK